MSDRDTIREFIAQNLSVFGEAKFNDEDNIFERGFVDSMFALRLVEFVEREFGIRVENEDLDLSNFSSVTSIFEFVDRKKT